MKIESFKIDSGFENRGKYGILHEGVKELQKGEQIYIGPLASCYGLIIPLESGGAITSHIPSESKKMIDYLSQIIKLLQQLKPEQLNEAFLYSKEFKTAKTKEDAIDIIKQIIEQKCGVKHFRNFKYTNDSTYIILNTKTKEIKAMPLNADLKPIRGFSASTIKYE